MHSLFSSVTTKTAKVCSKCSSSNHFFSSVSVERSLFATIVRSHHISYHEYERRGEDNRRLLVRINIFVEIVATKVSCHIDIDIDKADIFTSISFLLQDPYP